MKIVHKTWYIFDPEKKKKAIENANPFRGKGSPRKLKETNSLSNL
jgi:hypothetical protein